MSLKNVSLETVQNFSETKNVTASYLQTDRHSNVSQKFQVIQPAAVGAAMSEKGFSLVSCITGKGRDADKLDFQRTISRYRETNVQDVKGLNLDIIYISKHLGRGCDELRLGFYRGVCANQWNVGTLFEMIRFRHTGDALEDIQTGIAAILSKRQALFDLIAKMQATQLDRLAIDNLAKRYAEIRLAGKENVVSVNFDRLKSVRRADDKPTDLFTVANVLQENVIRFPLPYVINTTDAAGNPYQRNMTTRSLRASSSQLVDLNGKLFDAASELVAA